MNLIFLKNFGKAIFRNLRKNGRTYAKFVGGMVFASAVTAAAYHKAYKKLEEKHRNEDAKRYQAVFGKRLKELEERYQQNEYLLKKRINEVCDEFEIEHVC